MLSQGHCRDRGVTSSLTKTSKHRAVCLSRCPGPRDPASGDPSARTRHARLGKVRAPACAPRRCSQQPGCGRSLGARPRGRRRGCPCTVDRSSAVREDATSPSVRTWTGLEGRHPGLSPTAEFPLLHKGVAASGRVTWQGFASRQTGNSQDEAAGYRRRREKPTGHGDADSLRGDGSGPWPCSAPVRLLGCPGLGAPTRRAGSPERAWPEGTGPCRQGDGVPSRPCPRRRALRSDSPARPSQSAPLLPCPVTRFSRISPVLFLEHSCRFHEANPQAEGGRRPRRPPVSLRLPWVPPGPGTRLAAPWRRLPLGPAERGPWRPRPAPGRLCGRPHRDTRCPRRGPAMTSGPGTLRRGMWACFAESPSKQQLN